MKLPVKVEDGPKAQHDPVQKDLPLKVDNVSKDWKSESESVWLQFGGVDAFNKMHILNRCLVGQWGDFSDDAPLLSPLKERARYHWRLKGNLSLSSMGGALILFEFESTKEVERVLQEGEWIYKQKFLFLERWAPTTGCFREGVQAKSAWVRIMGLPLCLWHREFFKQVGDACGDYLGVDEKTMGGVEKFAVGTSASPEKWERGSGEVAGGGRRLLFYRVLVVGARTLGCCGNL